MFTRLTLLLLLLGAASCRRTDSSAQPSVDTTLVFVAPSAPTGRTLRIVVTRDAAVHADCRPVSLVVLDSLLSALKASNGDVSFDRASPERTTTAQQDSVIRQVANAVAMHELSLTLLSKTDAPAFVDAYKGWMHRVRP